MESTTTSERTDQTEDTSPTPTRRPPRRRIIAAAGWTVVAALAVAIVATAEKDGPASPDTRNPAGANTPLPVEPLWSSINWVAVGQILGAVLFAAIFVASLIAWRRRPGNPIVLMVLAASSLFWFDPINNWAIGLVYNPKLWHFPRNWPWLNISPIIEPLTSLVYAPYVLLPYFLAIPILRAVQRRRPRESFARRRPLVCLAASTFVLGAIWDCAQEILLTRTQFLTYTHVVSFGSIDVGENHQFPMLMASVLITIVMIPSSLLLYRDEDGTTQAEKVAARFRLYRRRPALTTFLVMAVSLNVAMICFSSVFWLARTTGIADQVACPWPYPTAKTWDPQGNYEKQGAPGPFTAGHASTWQIGQPEGRPADITAEADRCAPGRRPDLVLPQ